MHTTLTIIGCGRLGKSLARLWADNGFFQIQDVLNRRLAHSQEATAFIGAGEAISDYPSLRPAMVYLIAAPDDQIATCCQALAQTGLLSADSIVLHCSGTLPSSILQAAADKGAAMASVHPIRSFAAPEQVVQDFAGTWCGMEGSQRALDVLAPAFAAIGAQLVAIKPEAKIHYHAAAVFACNYLVTLLDVARQSYERAGIAPDVALQMMAPLVRETVENVFRLGPETALTGPVARGDMATAERQLQAVAAANAPHGDLYARFMKLTIDLAQRRNK